jgi:hypothetical protein
MANREGLTLSAAERILQEFGAYDWALGERHFWSITQATEALAEAGLPLRKTKVRKWFLQVHNQWPAHWQDLRDTYSWRISRTGLILMLAAQTAKVQQLLRPLIHDDGGTGPAEQGEYTQ